MGKGNKNNSSVNRPVVKQFAAHIFFAVNPIRVKRLVKSLPEIEADRFNFDQIDLDQVDLMIDCLSKTQFEILSWTACGKSKREISEMLRVDEIELENDADLITKHLNVDTISEAVILYTYWIDLIEEEIEERFGYFPPKSTVENKGDSTEGNAKKIVSQYLKKRNWRIRITRSVVIAIAMLLVIPPLTYVWKRLHSDGSPIKIIRKPNGSK